MPIAILAILAAVALLATGGAVTYVLTRPDAVSSAAPTSGCTEGSTEEMFVQHMYTCPDGTRVVTFASDKARDDYLEVATNFGAVVVEQGTGWARIRI